MRCPYKTQLTIRARIGALIKTIAKWSGPIFEAFLIAVHRKLDVNIAIFKKNKDGIIEYAKFFNTQGQPKWIANHKYIVLLQHEGMTHYSPIIPFTVPGDISKYKIETTYEYSGSLGLDLDGGGGSEEVEDNSSSEE